MAGLCVNSSVRSTHSTIERLLKSRDKAGMMKLANQGEAAEQPVDVIKEPYVLEFLDLPESPRLVESELESALISRLQDFLLEPGIWLCFHRQADPIDAGRRSFLPRPDLLSRPAQVLCCNRSQGRQTDTRGPRADADVCDYYDREILSADDNPTVGLILCAEKRRRRPLCAGI